MARVGFLGTGAIAAAMVRGLASDGHDIRVSERNATIAAQLARDVDGVSICPNDQVVAQSDIVILCLMPDVAQSVLPTLPFRADHKVISAMADVSFDQITALCAPAQDVSLTIPLPSIEQGGSPLPVYPDTGAARDLFGKRNRVIGATSEAGLSAFLGACATSLPLLELVATTRDWLARESGDAEMAETYMTALFASYFNDMLASGNGRLDATTQALSTPGGFNATLRNAMRDHGTPAQLTAELDGLKPRLGLSGK
jgi:pyrroline-5-carboxylate reductase